VAIAVARVRQRWAAWAEWAASALAKAVALVAFPVVSVGNKVAWITAPTCSRAAWDITQATLSTVVLSTQAHRQLK
jgi:hypothetical protein